MTEDRKERGKKEKGSRELELETVEVVMTSV